MKLVSVKCDLCKKPITSPADHYEFKIESTRNIPGQFVVEHGVQSPAKKREIKILDFHNTCNNEVATEWNNMIHSLEQEKMRDTT